MRQLPIRRDPAVTSLSPEYLDSPILFSYHLFSWMRVLEFIDTDVVDSNSSHLLVHRRDLCYFNPHSRSPYLHCTNIFTAFYFAYLLYSPPNPSTNPNHVLVF